MHRDFIIGFDIFSVDDFLWLYIGGFGVSARIIGRDFYGWSTGIKILRNRIQFKNNKTVSLITFCVPYLFLFVCYFNTVITPSDTSQLMGLGSFLIFWQFSNSPNHDDRATFQENTFFFGFSKLNYGFCGRWMLFIGTNWQFKIIKIAFVISYFTMISYNLHKKNLMRHINSALNYFQKQFRFYVVYGH